MLDPYVGDLVEFFVDVKLKNPKLEDASYISYEINIETNNLSFSAKKSAIRRRYSEFVVLHKILSKEFPALKTPALPPKFPFANHFDPVFIEKRREGLEEFLKKLISQKIYLSSKAFHLFLQSNFSVSQIKDIIKGKNVPVESHYNAQLNNRITGFESSCNLSAYSSPSISSHAELDGNVNSLPAVLNRSTASPSISVKCDNSPAGSKRVSFCDEVTVAQIHLG